MVASKKSDLSIYRDPIWYHVLPRMFYYVDTCLFSESKVNRNVFLLREIQKISENDLDNTP